MAVFVPHHARVAAPDVKPARWMLMLHGILGTGANLRTFARRLTERCPSWGFVLVDLRMHGQSQGAPPPHTLAAAADDLIALEAELGLPIAGVLGHSFGGKVALAYLERRRAPLAQAWVLDASPSGEAGLPPRASETTAVVEMLRGVPAALPSRERFFEIVAEHGFPRSMAEWLAMNVRRDDDGLLRLRLDLDAIEALLRDYFTQDLWHVLERRGYAEQVHVVIGGRSDTFDEARRARVAAIPHVKSHVLPEAGHWVHVDAADALVALVGAALAG